MKILATCFSSTMKEKSRLLGEIIRLSYEQTVEESDFAETAAEYYLQAQTPLFSNKSQLLLNKAGQKSLHLEQIRYLKKEKKKKKHTHPIITTN